MIHLQERARIARARERRNDAKNTITTEYVFERGNEISSKETRTRKVVRMNYLLSKLCNNPPLAIMRSAVKLKSNADSTEYDAGRG
jgi:hypothetical protein